MLEQGDSQSCLKYLEARYETCSGQGFYFLDALTDRIFMNIQSFGCGTDVEDIEQVRSQCGKKVAVMVLIILHQRVYGIMGEIVSDMAVSIKVRA
jgi:hypothetical protein